MLNIRGSAHEFGRYGAVCPLNKDQLDNCTWSACDSEQVETIVIMYGGVCGSRDRTGEGA